MDFLGVGPGELFLILILMLVVLGPERLPVFARRAGQMVVSVRNWVQRSPDAQMVIRMRQELEDEMVTLRATLTQEVQNVRDEMQTVRDEVIDAARTPAPSNTIAPPQLPPAADAASTAEVVEVASETPAADPQTDVLDLADLQPVPRGGRPGSPADVPPPELQAAPEERSAAPVDVPPPELQATPEPSPAPVYTAEQVAELVSEVRALRTELDALKLLLPRRTYEPELQQQEVA